MEQVHHAVLGKNAFDQAVRLLMVATVLFAFAGHLTLPMLTLFPMENLGLPFDSSSWVYGGYGTVASIVAIATSAAVDRLPSTVLAGVAGLASAGIRVALPLLVAWPELVLFLMCVVMPLFDVLCMTPLVLAMKRLVYAEYAGQPAVMKTSLDFYVALTYALTNGIDVVANLLYDALRHWDLVGGAPAANTITAWLAAGSILAACLTLIAVRRLAAEADGAYYDEREAVCTLICKGSAAGRFVRFMSLCTLLIGVRMLFRHLDLTLAVFMLRSVGSDSHFPIVQSVNPAVVVLLSPFVPALLRRTAAAWIQPDARDDYLVIVLGTALSAAGPVLLAVLLGVIHSVGAGGNEPVIAAAAALAILVFSVGEAIWSPRFSSYAIQIAPEGTEAVYNALATIPSLAVKLPTSYLSALLIDTWCPAAGQCNGEVLWSWIAGIACITPLSLLLARSVLQERTKTIE